MRRHYFVSVLLVSCLVLANMVSAATACCMDIQKEAVPTEHDADMPCHEMDDATDPGHTESQHECDCPTCLNTSTLVDMSPSLGNIAKAIPLSLIDPVFSTDPERIDYPPKPLS